MKKTNKTRVYEADLEHDLGEDTHNANAGTERGQAMLEKSISEFGAGRSMLADKDGRLIAGNKSREAFISAGMTKAIVVETDGTTPVVVKRIDLDLKSKKARRLAWADNRVGEVDLQWSRDVLAFDAEQGLLDGFFSEKEVAKILKDADEDAELAEGDGDPVDASDGSIVCPSCGEVITKKGNQ